MLPQFCNLLDDEIGIVHLVMLVRLAMLLVKSQSSKRCNISAWTISLRCNLVLSIHVVYTSGKTGLGYILSVLSISTSSSGSPVQPQDEFNLLGFSFGKSTIVITILLGTSLNDVLPYRFAKCEPIG
ncbi:hypothetical protein Ancab_001829 [Ancistrocladus abbreviatus]